MTFLGKIFVMVNLVISLMMATVGMGLYASSVDWSERPAKGSAPAGVAALRKAALKEAMDGIDPVFEGWKIANEVIMDREEKRQGDQKWFAAELVHVRLKANDANPAREVEIQENGVPKADPKMPHRPNLIMAKDRAGKNNLLSIAAYEGLLATAQKQNASQLDLLEKAFNADTQLTLQLTPAKGEKGGLRDRIVNERLKRLGIIEETESVEHLATKAIVEGAVIEQRIGALDQQIKSLEGLLRRLKSLDAGK